MNSNEVSYYFSPLFIEVEPSGSPLQQKGKSFHKKINKNLNTRRT